MYCPRCSTGVIGQDGFCMQCGYKVGYPQRSSASVGGIVTLVLGILGVFYGAITIASDQSRWGGYTYSSPFTYHEIVTMAILVIGAIGIVIGIAVIASSKNRHW